MLATSLYLYGVIAIPQESTQIEISSILLHHCFHILLFDTRTQFLLDMEKAISLYPPLPTIFNASLLSSPISTPSNLPLSFGHGMNPILAIKPKYLPTVSTPTFEPSAHSFPAPSARSTASAFLSSRAREFVSDGKSPVTQSKSGSKACGSFSFSSPLT